MIDWTVKQADTNLPSHMGGGSLVLKNIGKLNIIFGPNGSGKSQVMRALSGEKPEEYHLVSPERPGEFQYMANYASEEETGATRYSTRLQNITPEYRQRAFSRLSVVLKVRGTLENPPPDTHYMIVSEFLSVLMPEFTLRYIGQQNKDFAIYRASGEEVTATTLSSGEADLISVGLDMVAICLLWRIKNIPEPILFLDEPNVHLHPDLDVKLALGIKFLLDRFKVKFFISSHSTSLLSALIGVGQSDVRLFYMKKGPAEIVGTTPDEQLKSVASIMGGSTVLGSVFGLKMILVEGDDDFEIWNQAVRSSKDLKLSIMPPSGGKPMQLKDRKILTGLFAAMGNSSEIGYVVQDRDDRSGNPSNSRDEKMPMLWFACREAENLTLCEEVLAELGYDKESAKAKIIEQGFEESRANTVFADRMLCNISKDEMVIIQAAIYHQNSRWQTTIGKVIGHGKPTGELAEFLGSEIIEAFWV